MAGYVYTNENCIGCNRCISVCPVLTANQAVVVDGKPRIEVNHAQCINCGACFDACEHQAREYADDTEQFFCGSAERRIHFTASGAGISCELSQRV